MIRTSLVGVLGLILLMSASALSGLISISAHGDEGGETVRVIARLHEDGRIEFGLRTAERNQFPWARFFPTGVTHQNWLNSSLIELTDGTGVRIIARRVGDTRVEFGVRIDEPREDFLPTRRFFPRSATVGRWLSSTPVLLPAPETDEPEEPPEPPEDASEGSGAEEPAEASDVERISGGHRDGLIVQNGILGDPDAPILISEYGDPF